jgi:RNA 3'-terminal phosphate cyclase (ATP)
VKAAAAVGAAEVHGAEVGSTALAFTPRALVAGEHRFAIGTAGSATLVLQTVLPALLHADAPATVIVEGGTHNTLAPPFEYLARVYVPLLRRMGVEAEVTLQRHGFYPAGGGCLRLDVRPGRLRPIELLTRGELVERSATVLLSRLPFDIARRELDTLRTRLGWDEGCFRPRAVQDAMGPGNIVEIEIAHGEVTELFSAVGERGVLAETVATRAADEAEDYLASGVPVGRHLADQLVLPMALAGGGAFVTQSPTPHFATQCMIVSRFGLADVTLTQQGEAFRVDVRPRT